MQEGGIKTWKWRICLLISAAIDRRQLSFSINYHIQQLRSIRISQFLKEYKVPRYDSDREILAKCPTRSLNTELLGRIWRNAIIM